MHERSQSKSKPLALYRTLSYYDHEVKASISVNPLRRSLATIYPSWPLTAPGTAKLE
jgi:hypothetical protein